MERAAPAPGCAAAAAARGQLGAWPGHLGWRLHPGGSVIEPLQSRCSTWPGSLLGRWPPA